MDVEPLFTRALPRWSSKPCVMLFAILVAISVTFSSFMILSGIFNEHSETKKMHPLIVPDLQPDIYECSPGNWSTRIQPIVLGAATGVLLRDVCVGRNHFKFAPCSVEDAWLLNATRSFCCGDRSRVSKRRAEAPCRDYGPLLCLEYSFYRTAASVAPFNANARPALLPGRSYIMDTAVNGMQFGHLAAKFLQFFGVNEPFDNVVLNRVDRIPGRPVPPGAQTVLSFNENHIGTLFNWTVGERNVALYSQLPGADGAVCAQSAFFVFNYERMFHRSEEADRWRQLVQHKLGLQLTGCPPPRAAILLRSESFSRGFANLDLIDRVAARHGIARVDRVTINSSNDTRQHAELFASFGLLLSGHSSQLKNLMFSHPHTAVIEIVGRLFHSRQSAFQQGTQELGIIYHASKYHSANWTLCGLLCQQPNEDKNAMLTLNETILDEAFTAVLTAQRQVCPDLAY
jgi:hypothetical protein